MSRLDDIICRYVQISLLFPFILSVDAIDRHLCYAGLVSRSVSHLGRWPDVTMVKLRTNILTPG
jgi:hypothetical protein